MRRSNAATSKPGVGSMIPRVRDRLLDDEPAALEATLHEGREGRLDVA
jgi:hypothetical protein